MGIDAKLERSSLEAYGGTAIAILLWVLPVTWWLKGAGMLVIIGLLADISFRSPWTHKWSKLGKTIGSLIGACIVISIGYQPVIEQYRLDHRATKAAFQLEITDMRSCSYLPPYPNNTQLVQIRGKIDNSGTPSVAKDWSLSIILPDNTSIHTTFVSLGGNACGWHIDNSEGLEGRTEDREFVGVVRGWLGFAAFPLTPQELTNEKTTFVLSVKDKENNTFESSRRISDLGPRLIVPPAAIPPTPAQPASQERTSPETSRD